MTPGAQAHPHVWVTMRSEIVYTPDGTVTGVRHAWTFDDMFSAYALQGIETKAKGVFTREELAPLAEENVDVAEGIRLLHARPRRRQEGAVHRSGRLLARLQGLGADAALHAAAEDAGGGEEPVPRNLRPGILSSTSASASRTRSRSPARPRNAKSSIVRPDNSMFPSSQRLDKNFQASEAFAGMGSRFANKIEVTCP